MVIWMKKIFSKRVKIIKFLLVFVIAIIVSIMTYGFAFFGEIVNFGGSVTFLPDGKLEITNIQMIDSSNVSESDIPIFVDGTVEFNVTFSGTEGEYYITYSADIVNNSFYDYIYSPFDFTPTITASDGGTGNFLLTVEGINEGDVILAGETKTITMKFTLTVDDTSQTYDTNAIVNLNASANQSGSLLASLTTVSNDLTGDNELAQVTLSLINTYTRDISFTLASSNTNFILVDANGNDLGTLTIPANSTQDIQIYIKESNNSFFSTDTDSTIIKLLCDSINNIDAGVVELLVDATSTIDTSIPLITSISVEQYAPTTKNEAGQLNTSWTSSLEEGCDAQYGIAVYDANTNEKSNTIYDITDLNYDVPITSSGSYYVKVFGYCNNKSGEDYLDVEKSPYYKKSDTFTYYSITANFSYMSFTGPTLVIAGERLDWTLTASSGYKIPQDFTSATMGGETLPCVSSSDDGSAYYWFTGRTAQTGNLFINMVTGDVVFKATATKDSSGGGCLVEGTLVTLADGSKKKIEDIGYDDLLLVWDYERGTYTYEYPIWIEQEMSIDNYIKITFSDGEILNVAVNHGLYNADLNLFVTVNDSDNFKIGTKIAKIKNNQIDYVYVTNIENVEKNVKYYHVVSTRYYNIIANDILTTDDAVVLSNLYGFNDIISWPNIRMQIMGNKDNLYRYDEFSDIVPYYMFKGLRIEEAKVLSEYISKDEFRFYLLNNQVNENMWKKPMIDTLNNRVWMVTTSDDIVDNKSSYLIKEGEYYTLKEPLQSNNFIYWYNTSDGNRYYPGDKIQIWNGTHFVAVYK